MSNKFWIRVISVFYMCIISKNYCGWCGIVNFVVYKLCLKYGVISSKCKFNVVIIC